MSSWLFKFSVSNVGAGPRENGKEKRFHFTQRGMGQGQPSAPAITGLCQKCQVLTHFIFEYLIGAHQNHPPKGLVLLNEDNLLPYG